MKKGKKGVILFVLGLILVGINIPINTGIDYNFQFGVLEGFSKGANTYFLMALLKEQLHVDVFFNPLGYFMMFLGLCSMGRGGKFFRNAKIMSVLAMMVYFLRMALPFFVNQYKLITPVIILIVIEIILLLMIMYYVMLLSKKQIDNFKYMEVGKDLTFATELYGFAAIASYVTLPFAAMYLYFARGAYVVVVAISYVAILYYGYRLWKYTKLLGLFQEE